MLRIGEFAGLTGLSVKALRHYDEADVLVPDGVDNASGYRQYGEGQVRAGVIARLLRDAGVPLPAVASALATGDVAGALSEHYRRIQEERQAADRAFEAAAAGIEALSAPVSVVERERPAQPFVGQVLTVSTDNATSLSDEDANTAFGALFERLQASGLGPNGQFWTTLRAGERGLIEVVGCWPTTVKVDDSWCEPGSVAEVLPSRTELVSVWRPAQDEHLSETAMHPAAVALFDAIDQRGVNICGTEVRQTLIGETEDDFSVELSVSISA